MSDQNQQSLLTAVKAGDLTLRNRVVMSSLTRARANNEALVPTDLHVTYYSQRASAGLILTESVWISKQAIGFVNIPGIFTREQADGWKKVTEAVHEKNGRIFIQMGHSGAASHPDFFNGALPFGPSAINIEEKVFTPNGFTDTVTPKAYTKEDILQLLDEYRQAAKYAKVAGFDGIELHAQIFTLIPQFLSAASNQRTDEYGGSIENRSRILFEILEVLKEYFPEQRIGIKFTPAAFNTGILKPDENTIATYDYILNKLNNYELAFVELVGPAIDLKGTPIAVLQDNFYAHFRKVYKGTLMANLGFNQQTANEIIENGLADLVSFGTPFIANPDLVERFEKDLTLTAPDRDTFYTSGAKGYTDYPSGNH